jgi:uncharacterized protein
MKTKQRIILAGGSGFLGGLLARHFSECDYEVMVLTRSPIPGRAAVRRVAWDGCTLGDWAREMDGALALINLAGRSVDCRYHARNRRMILDSRLQPTRVLGEAVARCARPPPVWLNASTATIYKHSLDRPMNEATGEIGATPEAKDEFSVEVAQAWERVFFEAHVGVTRKVALRTAMVLGLGRNSVFPVLRRLVRLGLGGRMASGAQFVSWIHDQDFCNAIDWLIAHADLNGPVNVTAPNPLPNHEMMRIFRDVGSKTIGLPASLWMLEAGAFFLRTETELIIKSRRVVPGRLLASGFQFRFPKMEEALRDLEARL